MTVRCHIYHRRHSESALTVCVVQYDKVHVEVGAECDIQLSDLLHAWQMYF